MHVLIDDFDFLLINVYNANTEKEQVSFLNELTTILSNFENIDNHNVVFAGDFIILLDTSLDGKGGTPTFKFWSINKLIKLHKTLDLCGIWRIRNLKKRKYTFRQNIYLEFFTEGRLDYIFISQNLLEYVKTSGVSNALSVIIQGIILLNIKTKWIDKDKGKGLCKLNNSLISNTDFMEQLKQLIENIKQQQLLDSE